jgi:hypothetical protein
LTSPLYIEAVAAVVVAVVVTVAAAEVVAAAAAAIFDSFPRSMFYNNSYIR